MQVHLQPQRLLLDERQRQRAIIVGRLVDEEVRVHKSILLHVGGVGRQDDRRLDL